ncbi:TIGR00269 family protein [Methanolobus psychrotolerans]|uniref:TIGR00269 family protein n=1 Tax=Methanolobus psychrotolerans TaxID=1874706 RepID=UPI000B9173BE|nr:TIGR00269 family protein [Methanolobus psychrotolerans]
METKTIKCNKCNNDAIIYQKYSGMHLCKKHFIEDVERKIKLTIRKHYSIKRNEVIAVGLSGGKDSSTTLHILQQIFGKRPDIEIVGVSIDEGIEGYRPSTIESARELTEKLGIRHIVRSFRDEYGTTMDEIAPQQREKGTCSYCGVLRKSLLNKIALEIGATKLAIGHNLDDEAQTILLNHLKGDVARMVRLAPPSELEGLVLRMKPLRHIPEKEVALYAYLHDLPLGFGGCPYAHEAMRREIRVMLNEFEVRHPGTKYALLSGFDKISGILGREFPQEGLSMCSICGQACTEDICQACKLLKRN